VAVVLLSMMLAFSVLATTVLALAVLAFSVLAFAVLALAVLAFATLFVVVRLFFIFFVSMKVTSSVAFIDGGLWKIGQVERLNILRQSWEEFLIRLRVR
jgi:hypothetical protein